MLAELRVRLLSDLAVHRQVHEILALLLGELTGHELELDRRLLDALPPSVARRVFGAARATEEGGTLTIFASTGLAGEPMRLATTRIVLEPAEGDQPPAPRLAPASGTLRADLLG